MDNNQSMVGKWFKLKAGTHAQLISRDSKYVRLKFPNGLTDWEKLEDFEKMIECAYFNTVPKTFYVHIDFQAYRHDDTKAEGSLNTWMPPWMDDYAEQEHDVQLFYKGLPLAMNEVGKKSWPCYCWATDNVTDDERWCVLGPFSHSDAYFYASCLGPSSTVLDEKRYNNEFKHKKGGIYTDG